MGSVITEDGNTVYKYAKDILSYCSNRTDELIARLGKAKEPVKFGLPLSVGSVFFSNVLLEYNENIRRSTSKFSRGPQNRSRL